MTQLVVQPQMVGFCHFHLRVADHTGLRTLGCICKEPAFSANDKGTDGVFNLGVTDLNLPILNKRTQVRLLIVRIGHCVLQFACRTWECIQLFSNVSITGPSFFLRYLRRFSVGRFSNTRSSSNSLL